MPNTRRGRAKNNEEMRVNDFKYDHEELQWTGFPPKKHITTPFFQPQLFDLKNGEGKKNNFKVEIEETDEWFIEDEYLVLDSNGFPMANNFNHDHNGCYAGRTGHTDIQPIYVQSHPGVKIKKLTVTHDPYYSSVEPNYPDLTRISQSTDIGDIKYSLEEKIRYWPDGNKTGRAINKNME